MAPKNSTKNSAESAPGTPIEMPEFPDWSGMERFARRLTPQAALLRNEELLAELPAQTGGGARRPVERCEVEFVL
jgi:hypothetical protein